MVNDVAGRAAQIAAQAHAGQMDKTGHPYIGHPARVAQRLADAGEPPETVAAGWLHDVLEDTPVSAASLAAAGIPDTVVATVEALTRQPGEPSPHYLGRLANNPAAITVKLSDVADNLDPARLHLLGTPTQARLEAKYAATLAALTGTPMRVS